MFFSDGSHRVAHQADDDQRERRPQQPAAHHVEQGHAEAARQRAEPAPVEDGDDEQRHVPQMDQPAVGGDRQAHVHERRAAEDERDAQRGVDQRFGLMQQSRFHIRHTPARRWAA